MNVTHGLKGTALTEVGYTRSRQRRRFIDSKEIVAALVRGILRMGIVWKAFSESVGQFQASAHFG